MLGGAGIETFQLKAPIAVQGGDVLGLFPSPDTGAPACSRGVSTGGALIRSSFDQFSPFPGETVPIGVAEPTFDLNESANLVTGGHTIGQVGASPNNTCGPMAFVRADGN
jgi:hypothetical protein